MTFNIETFKAQGLYLGGARPNQFAVDIEFPTAVVSASALSGAKQSATVLTKAASLPPSTLGVVNAYYFGRAVKYAGDRTFEPWTISIYNEEDFLVRNAIESWSDKINAMIDNRMDSRVSSVQNQNLSSYKQDLLVSQFQKTGPGDGQGIIKQYKIVGAFPTVVGEIRVDWENQNQVELFDVTWEYDYWVPSNEEAAATLPFTGLVSNTSV